MLLIDLTHTSHTRARTGIQKVTRSLRRELSAIGEVAPICHDRYRDAWRPLRAWEEANLAAAVPARKRGARWPWWARVSGRIGRYLARTVEALPPARGLVVPEIFSPEVAVALRGLRSRVEGPAVALFHDAIALRLPEISPAGTVSRFPAYLAELLEFDGIAAVSEDSRQTLVEYWDWLGAAERPPVTVIPLGIDPPATAEGADSPAPDEIPVILTVGTLEARKNHVALFEACERLWQDGREFELDVIGMIQEQTGGPAAQLMRDLQSRGRALRYDGPADDARLESAYRRCRFTVYPSIMEGFGLPVLESVARGRPCICSATGALGESAAGGGCLALEQVDAGSLAGAIAGLLDRSENLRRLQTEASARRLRRPVDHARELADWLATLPRRTGIAFANGAPLT